MSPLSRQQKGLLYALAAFVFWGLVPIYFKALAVVSPFEILAHRVLWSVPVTALLITLGRGWPELKRSLSRGKVRATLMLSAALVAMNWFIFIYAINTGRILQTSLGYYINPLVNVVLGMVFLGERLRRRQVVAVLMAAAGTLNLALRAGRFPWIALVLAFSFAFYGLIRKTVDIEAVGGLLVETSLLSPLAAAYLAYLALHGQMAFWHAGGQVSLLLGLAGMVTSFPLVWFTAGARRIPLALVGILQYVAPTLTFLLAVLVYHEEFTPAHQLTFALIWGGVALYVYDSLRWQVRQRQQRAVAGPPPGG